MNVRKLGDGAFSICEWLARLATINLFWVMFTVLGLGIFGWAPALAAAFTVLRQAFLSKGLIAEDTASLFTLFKDTFKKEFVPANVLGVIIIWGSALLYLSGRSMMELDTSMIPRFILIAVVSLFVLIILLIFPVRSHMKANVRESIRYSLLLGVANLQYVFFLVITMAFIIALFIMFPGVMVFYGASLPAAVIMNICLKVFKKSGLQPDTI
ncbi:DUF624 domain-containing protein [Salibacterium salarium]|uniref:DUF624 domain-containing protein n=1 Tax=Salibacterium salarium TaxID=284579 RepID=A0A428N903_9BACI|nr:DUF624 domain-containing protein [Salibacterium salarium]RSL34848.1 DUF624 domain-containing protein [Salibacterium salarium]